MGDLGALSFVLFWPEGSRVLESTNSCLLPNLGFVPPIIPLNASPASLPALSGSCGGVLGPRCRHTIADVLLMHPPTPFFSLVLRLDSFSRSVLKITDFFVSTWPPDHPGSV